MVAFADLLAATPTFEVQWTIAFVQAVFWFFFIKIFTKFVVKPYLSAHPKKDQFAKLNQRTFKDGYGIDFNDEGAFDCGCLFISILVQHGIGGLLCAPSAFGISVPFGIVPSVLASYGALCETGWELQDTAERFFQLLFMGAEGKTMNPVPLLVILFFHHGMGIGMVLPMNVYYGTNAYYHEMVFNLQGAACLAMGLQNAGYLLDIKSASGLRTMKIYSFLTWITILWSRVLRYVYLGYMLLYTFRSNGDYKMFYGGCTVALMMSLINTLFFLDGTAKLKKFLGKKHEDAEEVEASLVEVSMAMTHARTPFSARKEWTKVRGALHMGALKAKKAD